MPRTAGQPRRPAPRRFVATCASRRRSRRAPSGRSRSEASLFAERPAARSASSETALSASGGQRPADGRPHTPVDRLRRPAGELLEHDRAHERREGPVRVARPVADRPDPRDETGEHGIAELPLSIAALNDPAPSSTTCARVRVPCRRCGRARRAPPCLVRECEVEELRVLRDPLAVGRLRDHRDVAARCTNAAAPGRRAAKVLGDLRTYSLPGAGRCPSGL